MAAYLYIMRCRPTLIASLFLFLWLPACADADVALLMEQYLWKKRVLVVLSPSADDPRLAQQRTIIAQNQAGFEERDLVVWEIVQNESVRVDDEHMAHLGTPPFYAHFETSPAEFQVILLGKDGEEKLRSDAPVLTEQLFSLIDAMPMRQREMQ